MSASDAANVPLDASMRGGEAFGIELRGAVALCSRASANPVHWWAGFFSALAGMAIADIGGSASQTLLEAAAHCSRQVAQEIRRQ